MLTQEQIDFYRTNGYVVVKNLLTGEELDRAHRIIDDFLEQSRTVTEHTTMFDLEPGHSASKPMLRRLKTPARHHPFFDELLRSDRILDRVAQLIGPDFRTRGNKLNMKLPRGGSAVEWHQDFAHYPHTNDDLCAAGIALDEATMENGCMMVIPGSHQGPIYDHHQDDYFIGAISPGRDNIDLSGAVPLELAAGDISIHHVRTLHGSAPNTSDKPRRFLLFEYAATDAWPAPLMDPDGSVPAVLRGKPTYNVRYSSMQARVRGPYPETGAGSIYQLHEVIKEEEKVLAAKAE